MLSKKNFKVIKEPKSLSIKDVYELITVRTKRHNQWLHEVFIGTGLNHPLNIFYVPPANGRRFGQWTNFTTQYKTREQVIEYLDGNNRAFMQIAKSFDYTKEKPMSVQELIEALSTLDLEATTNIISIGQDPEDAIMLLDSDAYWETNLEILC